MKEDIKRYVLMLAEFIVPKASLLNLLIAIIVGWLLLTKRRFLYRKAHLFVWPQFNGSSFVAPLVIFQVVVLACGLGLGPGLKSDEENAQSYRFNSTCKYYDNASFKQKNVKNQKIKWLEQSCSSNHEMCPDGWDFLSIVKTKLLYQSIDQKYLTGHINLLLDHNEFYIWRLEIWGYESCSFYWINVFWMYVFFQIWQATAHYCVLGWISSRLHEAQSDASLG